MDNEELQKRHRLVDQRQAELADARKAYDRHSGLARAEAVQHAIDLLAVAEGALRRAYEDLDEDAARIQELHDWRVLRAPPALPVYLYGAVGTKAAWARYDRQVAEWKAKMRNGEFPPLRQ
jgi:hypothetical protein